MIKERVGKSLTIFSSSISPDIYVGVSESTNIRVLPPVRRFAADWRQNSTVY